MFKILTTTIPTTPPITFVIISVVSETPIDKIYCGSGSLSMPRKQEVMAAYNRYRKLIL
ncbi:MAG: hypothetical protein E7E72_07270 [Clostridium sp.]|nr:hypothetical protein [Clostridium sp.]